MEHIFIEVNKLEKSPHNARRSASKAAAADMKASILAHGLMQNLVVTDSGDGTYRVIAGSRRLKAIRELQKEGQLPPDFAAPCQIADNAQALEMSLAENTVRLAMHPADEFDAFTKLIEGGSTTGQVAERFGVTSRHVEERLKLGKVAPKILQAYRADKLTLERLKAFTITDDHRRQLEVFAALEDWHSPRHIRCTLTGQVPEASGKLASFVGLDAYHEAGGVSRADLFGDEVYLESPDLLNRLATEKLEGIRQQLEAEGWKWVEISPERDWEMLQRCGRIHPVADSGAFDPQQQRHAGCYISIDGYGRLSVEKGLVKREDRRRVFPAETSQRPDNSGMPATLRRELAARRQQAAQAEIAANRLIAFDVLVFTTACKLFGSEVESGMEVDFKPQVPAVSEPTPASVALSAIEATLPLAWLEQPTEAARFEAFCRLTDTEKLGLLAYCTATTLKPTLGGGEATASELALSLTAGNMAGYWRPTKASYLGRITRSQLLALGGELLGSQWPQSRSNDKKAELADELERVFAQPEHYARNAGHLDMLKSWLPSGMAFGTVEEEAPVKTRKRKAA